ncbi:hypothetical protein Tco_0477967 [Tanacetum coccineum]
MLENYHSAGNVVDTTLDACASLTCHNVDGQGIKAKNAELHLILQAKEDPEPKEDLVVMLPASDAVKRGITRTSVQTMETKSVIIKFEVISTNLKTIKSNETLIGNNSKPQPSNPRRGSKALGRVYAIVYRQLLYKQQRIGTGHTRRKSELDNESRLQHLEAFRTQRYIKKGCQLFLLQVTKKEEAEISEKRIEDVLVVRDFPEVFLEDLPGRTLLTRK